MRLGRSGAMKKNMHDLLGQLYRSIAQNTLREFATIKQYFNDHPLFVMFEPKLNCNPKTDHLLPKNVYPLFEDLLMQVQGRLYLYLTLDTNQSIEHFVSYSAVQNDQADDDKTEIYRLEKLLAQTRKDYQDYVKQFNAEKTKYINYIKDIKEQIYIMSRSGLCYAPDFLGEYFTAAKRDDKLYAKIKIQAYENAAKEQGKIQLIAMSVYQTAYAQPLSNSVSAEEQVYQPYSPVKSEYAAEESYAQKEDEFACMLEYRERILEYEYKEKSIMKDLLTAQHERKQLDFYLTQARQLIAILREKMTDKEWNQLIQQQQKLVQDNAERNYRDFLQEFSIAQLVGYEAPKNVQMPRQIAAYDRACDPKIPVDKLLAIAPEMMDYVSIASLQARYKVLQYESDKTRKNLDKLTKSYDACKERLHDLEIVNQDNEKKLKRFATKSKKQGRTSGSDYRTGNLDGASPADMARYQGFNVDEPSSSQLETPRAEDLQTVIEKLVSGGLKLSQIVATDGSLGFSSEDATLSRPQIELLKKFCDVQGKKLSVLSPVFSGQRDAPYNSDQAKDYKTAEALNSRQTPSLSETPRPYGTIGEGENKMCYTDVSLLSRNYYLGLASTDRYQVMQDYSQGIDLLYEQATDALAKHESCSEQEKSVRGEFRDQVEFSPDKQQSRLLNSEYSERELKLGSGLEDDVHAHGSVLETVLSMLGLVSGQSNVYQFMADNKLSSERLQIVAEFIHRLYDDYVIDPARAEQERHQFEQDNEDLERGVEMLNEIHYVAKQSVDFVNVACQCGDEAVQQELDCSQTANLISYKVSKHLQAKNPRYQADTIYKNYYYDVPGQNVYEKLFNAASILRYRYYERMLQYARQQRFGQLHKLYQELEGYQVFGQDFFYKVDMSQSAPPQLIEANTLLFQSGDATYQMSVLKTQSQQLEEIMYARVSNIYKLKYSSPVAYKPIITFEELMRQWNRYTDDSRVLYIEEMTLAQEQFTKNTLDFLMNLPGDYFKNVVKPLVVQKPYAFEGYLNKTLGINKRRSTSTISSTTNGQMVYSVEVGTQLPQLSKTMGTTFPRKNVGVELKQLIFHYEK